MKHLIHAALYLRVSTDGQTVEAQRAPLAQLAAARGWTPVWYEEVASSVKHRPVLERMLDDAKRGRVSAIAVVALDRLGRSMLGILQTVDSLARANVTVVSLRETWLDLGGPVRQLLIAVMGWMAENERLLIVERTRAGLAHVRRHGSKSGKPIGRPPADLLKLGMGERAALEGKSIRAAAREAGVAESILRRHLLNLAARHVGQGLTVSAAAAKARVGEVALTRHLAALTASQNVEGGGARLSAASAP
ncbi:recombinase family protein [Stigmatella erecta]|uniref:Site-specific DNA recombinase n=1 Tax=Stigmatella erecta TaxID=83460 RepID=A0A1I0LAV2_9BACT|nr:recombinase family protein [Stigmatella erecta]SEU36923.1 Site-specific DNA recombinase [Stigmatella erecta]